MDEKKTKKTKKKDNDKVAEKHLKLVEKLVDTRVDALRKELDKPVKKDINVSAEMNKDTSLPKEEKLKLWVKGMVNQDMSEYRAKAALDTDDSRGGPTIPPEEFIAEVLRLEEEYGVARQYADVRRTDRTSIRGIKGGDDVSIYKTDEAGEKTGTSATYEQFEITFDKYAAIAPVTDELLEDSAINIWNDLTARFARAFAQLEDQLVFGSAGTGANVNVITVSGTSFADITFDELNEAIYGVPTPSMKNGRFYLHRTVLGEVQRLKDNNNNYIWQPGPNGIVDGTIWGYPYSLSEALPSLAQDEEDAGFILFGDLKNTILGERTLMQAKIFDSGSVVDADSETINLLTQDVQAMRVVKRLGVETVFENAYSVIKTLPSIS